ncbi:MAG: hypothetical protein MJE68_19025, partial [Proteobacteria bacterium]|nr:hypothetical protein [Pseudomonadota bacterium]
PPVSTSTPLYLKLNGRPPQNKRRQEQIFDITDDGCHDYVASIRTGSFPYVFTIKFSWSLDFNYWHT